MIMTTYHVTWAIDIDADSPEQAALEARDIQKDPTSTATVFEVGSLESSINDSEIDLADWAVWMDDASDSLEVMIPIDDALAIDKAGVSEKGFKLNDELVTQLEDQLTGLDYREVRKVLTAHGWGEDTVRGSDPARTMARQLVWIACHDIAKNPDGWRADRE